MHPADVAIDTALSVIAIITLALIDANIITLGA